MEGKTGDSRPLCLDAETQRRVQHRLRRLGGQVGGIERMIDEQRGCEEILTQIASLKQAANGLAAALLQAHVQACVRASLQAGDEDQAIDQIEGAVKSVLRHT